MGNNKRVNLNKKPSSLKKISYIFGSILFFSLLIFSFNFLKIKNIKCLQNNQICDEGTIEKLSHLNNKSIFFTDFDKTLSQFHDYKISKKLPSTLILELSEQQSNHYSIGEDLSIFVSDQESLDKELNDQINNLYIDLKKYNIEFNKVFFKNNTFIVIIENEVHVIIERNDVKNGTYKLGQILNNLKLKEIDTAIKEIDTRFKMPVLKTKHSVI
ncbi:MAG: hypothetical protein OEX81_01725 [Candidatus Pacebacteria bacterium]|nr:hypothetical protein [Candidatus Paceibacterota bacterium]